MEKWKDWETWNTRQNDLEGRGRQENPERLFHP